MPEKSFILLKFIQKPNSLDEAILGTLKRLQGSREAVSFSTIYTVLKSCDLNADKGHTLRRLEHLRKYSKVEKMTSRKTSFWRRVDDD